MSGSYLGGFDQGAADANEEQLKRLRKEKELAYYKQQLEEICKKIDYLDRELTLTNIIIDIIQCENLIELFPNDRVESQQIEDKT